MLLRLSQPDAAPPASGLISIFPFVWTSTRTCAAPSMSTAKMSLYFGLHPCGSCAMFVLDDQEDERFTKPLTLTKPFAHEYSACAQVAEFPQFVHPDNNGRLWRPATANRMPLKLNQSRGFEPASPIDISIGVNLYSRQFVPAGRGHRKHDSVVRLDAW